jgi:ABC-2 type transport system permease protein
MKNIWVVLKKEYLTRIKNKTFVLMTFLAPVLIALFYGGAIYFATIGAEEKESKNIYFNAPHWDLEADELSFEQYTFIAANAETPQILQDIESGKINGWLQINDSDLKVLDSAELLGGRSFSLAELQKINAHVKTRIQEFLLLQAGISDSTLKQTEVEGTIHSLEINTKGAISQANTPLKSAVGFAMAFIIYLFIFIYGSMVMRSAMEEKTHRIVEVIVSSVKPFDLMMGKILGVALVGLTQFFAWVLLSFILLSGLTLYFSLGGGAFASESTNIPIQELLSGLRALPFGQIITVFILFFLGGYLLYSSIFAAIGSAINQETDIQQFMLPVSLPLVFGFIIAQSVVFQSPNGHLAQIFSIIPFTSPIVMAVRAPFDVPTIEIVSSFILLLLTFIFFVWLSSKIYRVGVLMYGKKPRWKDLWRWIRQS